jgi:glycosyltransferase involved in cell wall biosynthesis
VRILLAVNAPSSHLFPLPNGWADRGHDVTVVMDRPEGRFGHAREHVHPGVRLLTLGRRSQLIDAVSGVDRGPTLGGVLTDQDAVVVGGYASRAAREVLSIPGRARPQTVMLAERPDPRTRGPRRVARDAWIRRSLRRIDAVWSMSRAGDAAFAKLGRAPTCRIPYPIAVPARVDRDLQNKWAIGVRRRLVVLGSLTERKRPSVAVATVRHLVDSGVDVEVVLAGSGPLEQSLRRMADRLPVTFVGHLTASAVEDLLSSAHVLLHPAAFDGWGMAVAEAAAAGVPVVSTHGCDAAAELEATSDGGVRCVRAEPAIYAETVRDILAHFAASPLHRIESLLDGVRRVSGTQQVVERSLRELGAAERR